MNKEHKDPNHIDLEAPRLAWYKQKKSKTHPDTVYWVDIKLAQQQGFKFYQTRSNAFILYDTQLIVSRKLLWRKLEIRYEKENASPRPPPKISFKDTWMKEVDSEVAGGSEDPQQTQPKSQTHLSTRGNLWVSNHLACQGDRKRCLARLRKHQLKNGEICKELRASVCWRCR